MSIKELTRIYKRSMFYGYVSKAAVRFMQDFSEYGASYDDVKQFLLQICIRDGVTPNTGRVKNFCDEWRG